MKRVRSVKNKKKRYGRLCGLLIVFVLVASVYECSNDFGIRKKIDEIVSTLASVRNGGIVKRGNIYDRQNRVIAENGKVVKVVCNTKKFSSKNLSQLANILNINNADLIARLSNGGRNVILSEGITKEQGLRLEAEGFSGIYLKEAGERVYPTQDLVAHLTGVVDDGMGLFGLEFFFDKLLTGNDVTQWSGQELSGVQDVILTLDLDIQEKLRDLLLSVSSADNVIDASGYVVNVDTGEVLAGAQYPSFKPASFDDYPLSVSLNNFLQLIPIPNKYQAAMFGACSIYSSRGDSLPWSVVSVNKKISSEIKMWKWMGVSDEIKPDFAPSERASRDTRGFELLDPYSESKVGVVKTTPVQLLMAMSAIATGQSRNKIHVIDKLIGDGKQETKSLQLNKDSDLFVTRPESTKEIRKMLSQVGQVGDYHSFFIKDEQVVSGNEMGPIKQELLYTFLVTEKANLAMLLLVEKNSNVITKKEMSANVIEKVEKTLADIKDLQDVNNGVDDFTRPSSETEFIVKSGVISESDFTTKSKKIGIMPNLFGLSFREALNALDDINCNIKAKGSGFVDYQQPVYGSPISDKDDCAFSLSAHKSFEGKYVVN